MRHTERVRGWVDTISNTFNLMLVLLLFAFILMVWSEEAERARNVQKEVRCLAVNVYREAGLEPFRGQEAVALVTMLRVASKQFPSSVCAVVYQPRAFSWTLDPHKRNANGLQVPETITQIARRYVALQNDGHRLQSDARRLGLTADTLYYKRFDWDENNPNETRMSERNKWFWQQCVETVRDGTGVPVRIGAHVFYRPTGRPCPPWPGPTPPLPRSNPRRPPH